MTFGTGDTIAGPIDSHAFSSPASVRTFTVTFPATSNGNIHQQNATPAPGRYSNIQVDSGAVLVLRAGTYYADSLNLRSGATLSIDSSLGPVQLYVLSSLTLNGTVLSAGGVRPHFLLAYVGSSTIEMAAAFTGTLLAPNAVVQIDAGGGPKVGQIFAKSISTDPDASFAGASLTDCSIPLIPNGTPCDDGNACTRTDTCQAGACVGANPVVCSAPDSCHATSACDPATGACSNSVLADGTSCDDGNTCTTGDACTSGICVGTADPNDSNPACVGPKQGFAYAPHQGHPLPNPPQQNGCFVGTSNGWVSVPCADDQWHAAHPGHFEVSRGGVVTVPPAAGSQIPFVYGQVETTIIHATKETDYPHGDNAWGVQMNTQGFPCTGGLCVYQFIVINWPGDVPAGQPVPTSICIEPVQVTPTKVNYLRMDCVGGGGTGVHAGPLMRPGAFKDFDYVNVAGYTFDVGPVHKIGLVAQFSMTAGNAPTDSLAQNQIPGLYATTMDDTLGLSGNWHGISGGIMGQIDGSEAHFTDAEVMTLIAASSCPGDTSASGPTCPNQTALSSMAQSIDDIKTMSVQGQNGIGTVESDNLTLVHDPAATFPTVTFPNANLVVAEFLSSTNVANPPYATCLASLGDDVFIKDNEGDNGGVPSNAGGVPFWESPDIFIVPAGAPQPGDNDVAADFQVTLGQSYDVYLRINNDYGCSDVTGIRVLINGADPGLGYSAWSPITANADTGHYVSAPGNPTVPAHRRKIVGPFGWKPDTSLSGGHKCLLAAVAGGNQSTPFSTPLAPAYSDHRIAQRNIQVTNGSICDYVIGNTSSVPANLLLGVNVTPVASISGSTIALSFDDPSSDWYTAWKAQADRLSNNTLSVTRAGQKTVLTLGPGTSTIALDSVALQPGAFPHVTVDIQSTADPGPNVAISSVLQDPIYHTVILENGGSCHPSPFVNNTCQPGLTLCANACVDLSGDASNCGACGHSCGATSCLGGICVPIN